MSVVVAFFILAVPATRHGRAKLRIRGRGRCAKIRAMSGPSADWCFRAGRVAIIGSRESPTNRLLEREWRALGIDACVLAPGAAEALLQPGDVALGRIDVRRTLNGLEPGLLALLALARRGLRVVNQPAALLAAHDKLRTARLLAAAGLLHPHTVHLRSGDLLPEVALPLVLKPRFGSWGADVSRCDNRSELEQRLALLSGRSWFVRQGVLVQELTPPCGHDLRLLVAGGRVVGAIRRCARPGDWRTNISLGGTPEPVVPPRAARSLALAAASVLGADLVGVDLLPDGHGFTVVELNGAVDFDDPEYSPPGGNIYAAIAEALNLESPAARPAETAIAAEA
jgi:RimK family alpha-L-glutamate ligase